MKRTKRLQYVFMTLFLSAGGLGILALYSNLLVGLLCGAMAIISVYFAITDYVHYVVKAQNCEEDGNEYEGKVPCVYPIVILFAGVISFMILTFKDITTLDYIGCFVAIFAEAKGIWRCADEMNCCLNKRKEK